MIIGWVGLVFRTIWGTIFGASLMRMIPPQYMATFARFANVTLDREKLLDLVWGTSFYGMRTVDVHIVRLRSKLEGSGLKIETVWGSGYRLVEAVPA